MWYVGYARGRKEMEVEDSLRDLGITAWCGKLMVWSRSGKKRRAEPRVIPKLPNYIFFDATPEQFFEAKGVKHLAPTFTALADRDMRGFERFRARVDAEFAEAQRIAANANKAEISEYRRGQKLVDVSGRFGDTLMTFRRIVESAHELHPLIEAEMDFMGRAVTVRLDPLDVRAGE